MDGLTDGWINVLITGCTDRLMGGWMEDNITHGVNNVHNAYKTNAYNTYTSLVESNRKSRDLTVQNKLKDFLAHFRILSLHFPMLTSLDLRILSDSSSYMYQY